MFRLAAVGRAKSVSIDQRARRSLAALVAFLEPDTPACRPGPTIQCASSSIDLVIDGSGSRKKIPLGLLNGAFPALLDEHFVDDADDLSGRRMIERAIAVAWVYSGIKLENV